MSGEVGRRPRCLLMAKTDWERFNPCRAIPPCLGVGKLISESSSPQTLLCYLWKRYSQVGKLQFSDDGT
jgi:hypothetical protein